MDSSIFLNLDTPIVAKKECQSKFYTRMAYIRMALHCLHRYLSRLTGLKGLRDFFFHLEALLVWKLKKKKKLAPRKLEHIQEYK